MNVVPGWPAWSFVIGCAVLIFALTMRVIWEERRV